jgi:hypothetical protein
VFSYPPTSTTESTHSYRGYLSKKKRFTVIPDSEDETDEEVIPKHTKISQPPSVTQNTFLNQDNKKSIAIADSEDETDKKDSKALGATDLIAGSNKKKEEASTGLP